MRSSETLVAYGTPTWNGPCGSCDTTPEYHDPVLEFLPETFSGKTPDRLPLANALTTTVVVDDVRPMVVAPQRRPAVTLPLPGSLHLWWGRFLGPFAYGSLFGAAVVWVITGGMFTTTPASSPVDRPATTGALGGPASVPIPVTVVQRASPKHAEALATVVRPVANVPVAQRRAAVESARPVTSDRQARRGARASAPTAPVSAAPFLGSVLIESAPTGARVFVNSQSAGVTPLVLDAVPVGSRAIRVEADGYAAWSSVVRVVADQRTRVRTTLSPTSPDNAPR
jgi:hypothetical protein